MWIHQRECLGKVHYNLAVYEDRLGVGSRITELSGRFLSEKTTIYLAFLNLHKLKRAICSNAEKKNLHLRYLIFYTLWSQGKPDI